MLGTFRTHLIGPECALHFADVRFFQEQHTHARLTDAASDGERQGAVQDPFVERTFLPVEAALDLQLAMHALGVDTDAHRR